MDDELMETLPFPGVSIYEADLRDIAKQIKSWLDWPDGTSMAAILRRDQLEEWVNTLEAAATYIGISSDEENPKYPQPPDDISGDPQKVYEWYCNGGWRLADRS